MSGYLNDRVIRRLQEAEVLPEFSGTRYVLLEFLARGGTAAIYSAEDQTLQRRVAIKIMDSFACHPLLEERLAREAHILAKLEHPGIVPVHDAGTMPDGRVFYVMKFVEGSGLDEFLAGVSSLPERLRFFLRVCETVAFAHSRGILHRDLKPSNIMVGAFGEVLVMDWGLAKVLRKESDGQSDETIGAAVAPRENHAADGATQTAPTEDGIVMGTPGFMSPEQAQGKSASLDARTDIFSLGKLLKSMLKRNSSETNIPRALRAICERAAAEKLADRYGSVEALAEDISRYLDEKPVSAYRENLWERSQRFYVRYQAAILLIAVYLLLRILLVFYGHR
jgi:serine/threonine protein kinase